MDNSYRLLIVEDECFVARGIQRVLEGAGFRIVGMARSVEEAMSRLDAAPIDLMVTDIVLGEGGDGADLARAVWARRRVPTVFLSAHADPGTLRRAIGPGVLGYVTKPFDATQLLSALSVALYGRPVAATSAPPPEPSIAGEHHEGLRSYCDQLRALSPRERDVLASLLANRRVPHIAEELFISQHTVRNHLKAIFRKVGVTSQAQLVRRYTGVRRG